MEQTVKTIVNDALERVKCFGQIDQYKILDEVCQRLWMEAEKALEIEYLLGEGGDDE
ncbi:MAG: hypothetical protein MSS61_05455 [Bacteroidales bacterium]|nr:hypothetical protein [Bacteroidales bacterium]